MCTLGNIQTLLSLCTVNEILDMRLHTPNPVFHYLVYVGMMNDYLGRYIVNLYVGNLGIIYLKVKWFIFQTRAFKEPVSPLNRPG